MIISNNMIYFSYHNKNISIASHLALSLYDSHLPIWFDRFEVHPLENWHDALLESAQQASFAIVIICKEYLNTEYSLREYRLLYEADVPMLGIVTDDVSITELTDTFMFVDWIDLSNIETDSDYKQRVRQIIDKVQVDNPQTRLTEREHYLYQSIVDIEAKLFCVPTSRAIHELYPTQLRNEVEIRPRGYDLKTLQEWHLVSQIDNTTLNIEDVISWYDAQQQFMLLGEAGSGKTVISWLLALKAIHESLADENQALPILFDLALWTPEHTLEEYIESQWPLAYYWKVWLDTKEALLIFDNLDDFVHLNLSNVASFDRWLQTLSPHRLIVLARTLTTMQHVPSQSVHIGNMPNTNIQRFARNFLPDDKVGMIKRLVYENRDRLEHRRIDHVACGIELIAKDTQIALEQWFIKPIESLIRLRWQAVYQEDKPTFSLNYFIKVMRILAWHMMQQPYPSLIDYDTAEQVVFQITTLDVGLQLGILERVGNRVRFHAQLYASYLAIHHLLEDGLHKHLRHPSFNKYGHRLVTRWDDSVIALIDNTSATRQLQLVDQIAEIDPYLAYTCIRQYPQLLESYLVPLVQKLIEASSNNPNSRTAFTTVIQQLPKPLQIATTLLDQMQLYDWNFQQWLWYDLLRLKIDLPANLVDVIRKIDRQFEDTLFDLLSQYDRIDLVVYLSLLTTHNDTMVSHNAIWILGHLQQTITLIGLLSLIEHQMVDTQEEVIQAITHIVDSNLLNKLIHWIEQYPNHAGVIGTILYSHGRYVTGRFLMLCKSNQMLIETALLEMLQTMSEEEIATSIATYIVVNDPETQSVLDFVEIDEDSEMNIQQLLQSALNQLPRESLNRFLDDILRVVSADHTETSVVAQRAQSAITAGHTNNVARAPAGASQDDSAKRLDDDDWLIRLRATESLGELPADEALPLILEATNDEDLQVRLTAFSLLANFTGHDEVKQRMVTALSEPDSMIVDTVTDLLKSKDLLTTDELLNLLHTDNVQQLAATVQILCGKQDNSILPHLIPLLDDERKPWMDRSIADYAANTIEVIGTPEAMQALEQANYQQVSLNEPITTQTIKPTTKKSYTTIEKVSMSLNVLRDDNWELAQKSARFLRELAKQLRGTDNPAVVQILCDALFDDIWNVRWAVAEALGWIQDSEAIPSLVKAINDDNWIVQVAVVRALVELNASSATLDIVPLLKHPNNVVRETSAEALGALDNADAIPYLEQAFESDEEFVRLASIKAIHNLVDTHEIQHLIEGLQDDYVHVRWYAMQQLVSHFTPDDIPLLTELLNDDAKPAWEDMRICDFAHQALVKLNTPRSNEIVEQWLRKNG